MIYNLLFFKMMIYNCDFLSETLVLRVHAKPWSYLENSFENVLTDKKIVSEKCKKKKLLSNSKVQNLNKNKILIGYSKESVESSPIILIP